MTVVQTVRCGVLSFSHVRTVAGAGVQNGPGSLQKGRQGWRGQGSSPRRARRLPRAAPSPSRLPSSPAQETRCPWLQPPDPSRVRVCTCVHVLCQSVCACLRVCAVCVRMSACACVCVCVTHAHVCGLALSGRWLLPLSRGLLAGCRAFSGAHLCKHGGSEPGGQTERDPARCSVLARCHVPWAGRPRTPLQRRGPSPRE